MNFFLVISVCQSVTSIINNFIYVLEAKLQKKIIKKTMVSLWNTLFIKLSKIIDIDASHTCLQFGRM